ncbi:MAG: restriction endonuclease subunit S [Planctomycetaceae bacterium]|nr:restriction endonuclease subunit S [Planctomycetaceae bacterium]MCB9950991.1 restriction endonuclease subunit S [Planctomycetaceae bacterium]
MDGKAFLDQFGHIADSAGGIVKLRELVLQFAIRGLLTETTGDSATAIAVEFRQAFKKKLAPVKDDAPFTLKDGWEWLRIGEALNLVNGKAFKPTDWSNDGLRIIRIQNLNNANAPFNCCDNEVDEKFHVRDGDLLISWSGTPGTSFGAFIWQRGHALLNQHIFRSELRCERGLLAEFTRLAVNSQLDAMIAQAHGGVGLRHITKGKLEALPIPLPPLAEQKRIVAKVDELMGLLDELDRQQAQREEVRQAACVSVLHHLTAPTDDSDQPTKPAPWPRLQRNFNTLIQTPTDVQELRKTILQLAVTGRLVEQDESDEPAEKLLLAIGEQRKELIAEKLIRLKKVASISEDEWPYVLPSSWRWSRIGGLARNVEYGTSQKASEEAVGVPVLRMNNIRDGALDYAKLKYVPNDIDDLPRLFLESGDIIFNRTNSFELVGKTALYRGPKDSVTFASYLIRVQLLEGVGPEFVNIAMNAAYFRRTQIEPQIVQQCGQANFNGTKLQSTLIPIPPRKEQDRIVSRVNELMTLCDQLEQQLTDHQTTATQLTKSLTAGVLNGGGE